MGLDDGTNIDSWTFDALVGVVHEFLDYQNSLYEPQQLVDQPNTEERKPDSENTVAAEEEPSVEVADNVDPDKPLERAPEEEAEEEVEPIEVPPAVYRDFVEATDLKTVEYPVFDRVKIPSYSISKGGFLSSDYCLFLVETEQGKERLRVKRRDNDFYLLRQSLKAQFPYVMVPPLPKVNKKLTDAILQKRQRFF